MDGWLRRWDAIHREGAAGRPAAAARGVASFYALAQAPETEVCHGTACHLARIRRGLSAPAGTAVYCLGHCHAGPAVRDHGALTPPEVPVEVRTLTGRPLVTPRLELGCVTLAGYRALGGFAAAAQALRAPGADILAALEVARLRGRGGAGFPVARKWRAAAEAPGAQTAVVVNGDEGDPGSFIDRLILARDPFAVIEGLLLAGHAIGAERGVIYIRHEYPEAAAVIEDALAQAQAAGWLGDDIQGSGVAFHITVARGKGSYVCGEETALLNHLEHRRGEVRLRPPYPVTSGLDGWPTVVNNVETLVNVPLIVRDAAAFARQGTEGSTGTVAMCLDGGFARPGVVEVPFGTPLSTVLLEAGGTAGLAAVVLGGPMGSILGPDQWDVPVCFDAMQARDVRLGHGGLVALPAGTDWASLLRHWLSFAAHESCGRCAPCALGTQQALRAREDLPQVRAILDVMAGGSLCAFGRSLPQPLRWILDRLEGGR